LSEDSIGLREEYTLMTGGWFVYGVYRHFQQYFSQQGGHRGRDCMFVGFTTTISAYHL
jgi:hypothetical protein